MTAPRPGEPRPGGPGEVGSVTAEFAVVVPAVVFVLAISLSAMHVASQQVRLESTAFDAARLIARGDGGATADIARVMPGARVTSARAGDAVCAIVTAPVSIGILGGFTLRASGCALNESG